MIDSTQKQQHLFSIFAEEKCVGHMSQDSLGFSFQYDEDWLTSGYSLSPHLPLYNPADTRSTFLFLRNLLPEGTGLECLLNSFNLSRHDIINSLKHIASDTAGVLHFIFPDSIELDARDLSKHVLATRINEGSNVVIFDSLFRLGVAGVQKKINIHLKADGKFVLGNRSIPTTHILKFVPRGSELALNEYFCMLLAKTIGMPVAEIKLEKINSSVQQNIALLITRFDRYVCVDGTIRKHHIIDGCQALNLRPENKYERIYGSHPDVANCREGANFIQLFSFVREYCRSDEAVQQLLVWICFNLVIGNSDAHAKNISFYINHAGIQLTPFYDLVSIVFEALNEPKIDTSLSMAIGDEFNVDAITAYHLLCFAEEVDIPPNRLKRILSDVASACRESASLSLCHDADLSVGDNESLIQLIKLIKQRAAHFLREVEHFDDIERTLF